MEKNIISKSNKMNGDLDDDYTLYDNGEVLHEYDIHRYPGGYNLKETLKTEDLSQSLKDRLYNSASEQNKEIVKNTLGL